MTQAERIDALLKGFPADADRDALERLRNLLFEIVDPAPPLHETFWHYTSAEGLLGILSTGKLYAGHVSGLNDSTEYMHFAALLARLAKSRRATSTDQAERDILQSVIETLDSREVLSAGRFLTCFSTAENDLGQWRGYGGVGCSFAIEFDGRGLVAALGKRPWTEWLRVIYDPAQQQRVTSAVLNYHVSLLKELGLGERFNAWEDTFGEFHRYLYDILHLVFKHEKFAAEAEHRMTTKLLTTDDESLKFGSKRTMLTRRLELDWRHGEPTLPIRSIMVGPGQMQDASVVAINDLLRLNHYKDIPVTKSDIPYRLV